MTEKKPAHLLVKGDLLWMNDKGDLDEVVRVAFPIFADGTVIVKCSGFPWSFRIPENEEVTITKRQEHT